MNQDNEYHYRRGSGDELPKDDYVPRQSSAPREENTTRTNENTTPNNDIPRSDIPHSEDNQKGNLYKDEPLHYTNHGYDPGVTEKSKKQPFFHRKAVQITALVLCGVLISGLSGYGGAMLASHQRRNAAIQQSNRTAAAVEIKKVDGQKLMTPAEVYASTVNSVVSINSSATTNVFGQTVESASSGSGFVVTEDGYIVTNHHVVDGATSVTVTLYNGETYPAAIIGGDSDYDLAVLKVEAEGLFPVTLGNSADVNVGDTVLAIGNPLGELTFSQSQGSVSSANRAINVNGTPFNMIQVDASINPGNSGGPLMNLYGEVIGIVSAKYSSYADTVVEGLGFAIPISDVQTVIMDIMENGQVTDKAYLAITAGTMNAQMAEQYQIDLKEGVFVYAVEKGGAGERAGLRLGDVITKMGDAEIKSMEDLSAAKKGHKAGETVEITFYRDGEYQTTDLTFDEQPETTGQPETDPQSQSPQGGETIPGMDIFDFYQYYFGRN